MNLSQPLVIILITLFSFQCVFPIQAQHQEVNEKPGIWKGNTSETIDSTSLLFAFRSGKSEGHLRYFFSATDNTQGISDYYANAFGGGLRYETGKFHGFQMGISGFYIFNIGSSNFVVNDTTTNQPNRYELGLFDIQDPSNKSDIDRLEEFYINYSYRNSHFRFGRQLINTPFINLQDGRMRPTSVEGIWFDLNESKKLQLEGGFLYAVSPRSTVKYYNVENSVGLYPMGITTTGTKSDYLNHITSKGVAMIGIKHNTSNWITLKFWDLLFENVLNSALFQVDVNIRRKEYLSYIGGFQFIRQDAINQGGNEDPLKAYIDKNARSMSAGGKMGMSYKNIEVSANYTRIFKHGRYLIPREWGRDPFYTFLPRERNEGLGDVHAVVAKLNWKIPHIRVKTSLAAGYYKLPDVKNFVLNKYGLPSYTQINADIRYAFQGVFKGLETQLLVVAKINQGETYDDPRYEHNKVNMMLYNLIMNFHF